MGVSSEGTFITKLLYSHISRSILPVRSIVWILFFFADLKASNTFLEFPKYGDLFQ